MTERKREKERKKFMTKLILDFRVLFEHARRKKKVKETGRCVGMRS